MNTAKKISELLDGNGLVWVAESSDGRTFDQLIQEHGAESETGEDGWTIHTFPDGSRIAESPACWFVDASDTPVEDRR